MSLSLCMLSWTISLWRFFRNPWTILEMWVEFSVFILMLSVVVHCDSDIKSVLLQIWTFGKSSQSVLLCACQENISYPFALFIGEDAALATCCEVTVHFERVSGAALVRINPVFTWKESTYSLWWIVLLSMLKFKWDSFHTGLWIKLITWYDN